MSARAYPPAPGWSPDGHRIKAPLDDDRGPGKLWVYGAWNIADSRALTQATSARNTASSLAFLAAIDEAHPDGEASLILDNLASHRSGPIRDWLSAYVCVQGRGLPHIW